MGENARPALSVIIPAFNATRTISQTLKSLQAQTLTDWEAVIIDDGSADNTYGLARAFGERDERIWAHHFEKNRGAEAAVNWGLRVASGKFIAHLAADDYWLPEMAEKCVNVLESTFEGQMSPGVYTDFIEWQEAEGMKIVRRLPNFDRKYFERQDFINYSSFVFRYVAYLDPKWSPVADWEALLRTTRHRAPIHLPEILSVRRVHAGQISQRRIGMMVWKSFLLAFRHSPRGALGRLYQGLPMATKLNRMFLTKPSRSATFK